MSTYISTYPLQVDECYCSVPHTSWLINRKCNIHFDDEEYIHISFENHEANSDMHDMDLVIISH
jgi:hypothetical protein